MSTAICRCFSIVIKYFSISASVISNGSPSAKTMLLPGIRYVMYWMISRAGEVLRSLKLGNGKVRANGVCPVSSVWGLKAAGVMRLSGTN